MSDDELFDKYIEEEIDKEWYWSLNNKQQEEYKNMVLKSIDFAFYRLKYVIKNIKINWKG